MLLYGLGGIFSVNNSSFEIHLTALFGVVLLGERLDWRVVVALVGGFAGIFVHSQHPGDLRRDIDIVGVGESCEVHRLIEAANVSEEVAKERVQERRVGVDAPAGAQPMTAEDIAAQIHYVATLPPHLNINRLEIMPVTQSFAGFQVHRG